MSFDNLPNEIIFNIFKYVENKDLCNLYITNNLFNIIIEYYFKENVFEHLRKNNIEYWLDLKGFERTHKISSMGTIINKKTKN